MITNMLKVTLTQASFGCLVTLALAVPGIQKASALSVVDSINSDKTPANTYWLATEVGWTYTPGFSYDLSGVNTKFGSDDSRTVTLEVYSAAPALGGALLRSVGFTPVANAFSGGTFSPLSLLAGQSYFIGFRNTGGLNVNVTADQGASALDPLRYSFSNDGSYNSVESGIFTAQPILQFVGENTTSIPTPALLPGLIGLGLGVLRKRKAAAIIDSDA